MFRKKFASDRKRDNDPITWRGHEVTRIEAFSDSVFAFAITLLIVALEVPKTYHALMENMTFFLPFAICFFILFMIWFAQNMFFRRFGLHDTYTLVLNACLLFVVLFFVYPLKYLFGAIFRGNLGVDNLQQAANLFYIYGGGFSSIYVLFALMYGNAIKKWQRLQLTGIEIFETRSHMFNYLIIAIVAVLSTFLAFLGKGFIDFAGIVYLLIGPFTSIFYGIRAKKKKLLFRSLSLLKPQIVAETKNTGLDEVKDDKVN